MTSGKKKIYLFINNARTIFNEIKSTTLTVGAAVANVRFTYTLHQQTQKLTYGRVV